MRCTPALRLATVVAAAVGTVVLTACAGTEPAPEPSSGRDDEVTEAPRTPGPDGEIEVTGVVRPGVEAGCLLLRADGATYLLVGPGAADLAPGDPVTVTGTTQGDLMTACQQGIPLQVETASPAR